MTEFGGGAMTAARLKEVCVKNGLYRTPCVNDKLYLHYEGFTAIDGQVLGEYHGLKCLWLQGNGLSAMEGMEKLTAMRTLCIHENAIDKIQGLSTMTQLVSLNLSNNFVKMIEGLDQCVELETLSLGHNSIGPGAESIEAVKNIPKLQTLDLQSNRLEEGEAILDLVKSLPDLRVLYLQGNPMVKTMRNYRKRLISSCRELRYLDDRPVFEDERRRCEAWAAAMAEHDGDVEKANEAERAEIGKMREEKRVAEEKRVQAFQEMIDKAKAEGAAEREREQARKAQLGTTFSGENIVDPNRPPPPPGSDAALQPPPPPDFVDPNELD